MNGRRHEVYTPTREKVTLVLILVAFCVSDYVLLWSLPHLRISFIPSIGVPLIASFLVRILIFLGVLAAEPLARWRSRQSMRRACRQGAKNARSPALPSSLAPPASWLFETPQHHKGKIPLSIIALLAGNLVFSAAQVNCYIIEPLAVETTHLTLAFSDLDAEAPPVRVVQLTDLHIERFGRREAKVIQKVNALKPDLIVFTGDYINISYLDDSTSFTRFREFIRQLSAPYGIYAVRGSVEPMPEPMARLFEGTGVRWLEQEAVTVDVRGQKVTLVGVACSHRQELDAMRLAETVKDIPADAFTLLLYHSPDLIHEAVGHGMDLYLAGHTHGGQIRLPLYGAIITASAYGRRYAAGLFQESGTTMFVSRGIGFEGGNTPRARCLCRPEIVSIDLVGQPSRQ